MATAIDKKCSADLDRFFGSAPYLPIWILKESGFQQAVYVPVPKLVSKCLKIKCKSYLSLILLKPSKKASMVLLQIWFRVLPDYFVGLHVSAYPGKLWASQWPGYNP